MTMPAALPLITVYDSVEGVASGCMPEDPATASHTAFISREVFTSDRFAADRLAGLLETHDDIDDLIAHSWASGVLDIDRRATLRPLADGTVILVADVALPVLVAHLQAAGRTDIDPSDPDAITAAFNELGV
jgi:hypothetical protein